MVKVFHSDKITSMSEARLHIEEEFEHSFQSERSLIDYLVVKRSEMLEHARIMKEIT